jgi:hypothetical protein
MVPRCSEAIPLLDPPQHPNSETRSTSTHLRSPHTSYPHHTSTMPTPYEKSRMENIKRNRELLFSMQLDDLKKHVPPKTQTKDVAPTAKSRKRKSPPPRDMEEEDEFETKAVKTRATQDIMNTSGMRRSARNAGKTVDYKSEVVNTLPEVISRAARIALNSEKKAASGRRHNPYVNLFSARRRPVAHGTA